MGLFCIQMFILIQNLINVAVGALAQSQRIFEPGFTFLG